MRMVIVAAVAMTTSVRRADDTEDAHRQAISDVTHTGIAWRGNYPGQQPSHVGT